MSTYNRMKYKCMKCESRVEKTQLYRGELVCEKCVSVGNQEIKDADEEYKRQLTIAMRS